MPPDAVLRQSYDAFLCTFYPLCPLFDRHAAQAAFDSLQHWHDGDMQALFMSITGLIETAARLQSGLASNDGAKHNEAGPYLLKAVKIVSLRTSSTSESTYTAAASLVLSIAYHSLGEMQTSLYWIQQSITIAQIRLDCHRLHLIRVGSELENRLRLSWML